MGYHPCAFHAYVLKMSFCHSLERNKIDKDRWDLCLLSLRRQINTIKMNSVLTVIDLLNGLTLKTNTSIFKIKNIIVVLYKRKNTSLWIKVRKERIFTKFLIESNKRISTNIG